MENQEEFNLRESVVSQEKPLNTERVKRNFFSKLKNRFLALAMAGYLTLGAGWDKGLQGQLNEDREIESVSELVLENEITDKKLHEFKARVAVEEPEFLKLAYKFKQDLSVQLDGLKKQIINRDTRSKEELDQDQMLTLKEMDSIENGTDWVGPGASTTIDTDHGLISSLQGQLKLLENSHELVKINLDDIFWIIAFLNDSKISRDTMTKYVRSPTLVFGYHDPGRRAATSPFPVETRDRINRGEKVIIEYWTPEITIYPTAFMGFDKNIDANAYINVLIHELIHAFLAGSGGNKKIDRGIGDDFAEILDEGRTQSLAYKTIRYINHQNNNLKPIVSEAGDYDQNLVIAEIFESAARSHDQGDLLVKWQMGILNSRDMLHEFKLIFNGMGLDGDGIVKMLYEFEFSQNRVDNMLGLLADLLIKLKLQNIDLSTDFIRSILIKENFDYPKESIKIDEWTEKLSKIIEKKLEHVRH